MLRTLFPRAHEKFLSMPLLGPVTDGFDEWLAAQWLYSRLAQRVRSAMLRCMDADLRLRRVDVSPS